MRSTIAAFVFATAAATSGANAARADGPAPHVAPLASAPAASICAPNSSADVRCQGVWIVDDRTVAAPIAARPLALAPAAPHAIVLRDDFVKALDGGVGPACNGCCDGTSGRGVVVVSGGRKGGFGRTFGGASLIDLRLCFRRFTTN